MYKVTLTPFADPDTGRRNIGHRNTIALEAIEEAFLKHFGVFKISDIQISTPTS